MDFLSRKLLSNDGDDDDDLKKFCDRVCPKLPSDSCSSDCLEKCTNGCSYGSFSIPPPPYDSASKSPHKLSNLVTSTIALLSFTFLLVLCYAIYVRFYSARRRRHRLRHLDPPPATATATHQEEFLDEEQGPVLYHPIWYIRTVGLPAAVIDSIGVCKFKSGEGLIDGTECSVCLSEFEEDETLRLLPKCSHAFHLPCIDTWLRSHTNCPMCRAPVVAQSAAVSPPPTPAVASEETQMRDLQREVGDMATLGESSVRHDEEQEQDQEQEQDHEIHLPDDDPEETTSDFQPTRRSVSLDSLSALGITSVLAAVNEKMDREAELEQRNGNNSKKLSQGRGNSSSSAAAMNRSVSCSGKFLMRSSTQRSNGTNQS